MATFVHNQPIVPFPTTQFNPTHLGRLPKLDFPKFDGDRAQFWITCAVNYFEIYAVEPPMWIRVATMHFTGAAKRWLQSIEHHLSSIDWPTFCALIHERFSRDQHELLLCQLFNIRQTGFVSEYVDKFTSLIDQLKSYNPNPDLLSFTTRFIDSLCDDIRAVVLVARPTSLDVACTLALLQEEAGEPARRKDYRKSDTTFLPKLPRGRGTLPLPPPPARPAEDKTVAAKPALVDDKFATLKSFRRARGLCVRCAEKWVPGHKCAPTPQLHALQEIWALCQDDFEIPEDAQPAETSDTEAPVQLFLALLQPFQAVSLLLLCSLSRLMVFSSASWTELKLEQHLGSLQ
jgi:hypothetical protein